MSSAKSRPSAFRRTGHRDSKPVSESYSRPSAGGPYSLCSKCHDLTQVVANTSFTEHARHINDGFSCSTCHTAHGMGAISPGISGERMVNFDINVVAPMERAHFVQPGNQLLQFDLPQSCPPNDGRASAAKGSSKVRAWHHSAVLSTPPLNQLPPLLLLLICSRRCRLWCSRDRCSALVLTDS
jgi:hypothetical protein